MALENRDLKAGQKLVARYKGQEHTVLVLGDDKAGLGFELDGKTIFKSLSTAGNAVTGGSVNGWRFWSLEGELKAKRETEAKPAGRKGVKPEARVKQIRRVPNQKGVAEGQIKWHCSACMASFLADGPTEPDACPQGHPREATDEFTRPDASTANTTRAPFGEPSSSSPRKNLPTAGRTW